MANSARGEAPRGSQQYLVGNAIYLNSIQPPEGLSAMATAKEYFEKNTYLEFGRDLSFREMPSSSEIIVTMKVAYDFDGGSKFLRAYIPECENPDSVLAAVVQNLQLVWDGAADILVTTGMANTEEKIDAASLNFSGRLLVYTPNVIDPARWKHLADQLSPQGLHLLVRDGAYAKALDKNQTPLAFISHDSRDKDRFVRELASKLSSMLCPVWYDEYQLVPGQSLRESIESGLKSCPKCVVVLSKNFFSNPGWTKREFDMIYTREIIQGQRVMIPIWLDVTRDDVYEYSPILCDTVGIKGDLGLDEVARRLFNVLTAR